MLLDERNDIVVLPFRRTETAETVSCHDELVTPDAAVLTVESDIRRIAQTVTLVQMIACVHKQLLYVNALLEVFVSQFTHYRYIPLCRCTCLSSAWIAASKLRMATCSGVSTPGLK